jgi:outer membrane protein assembly factor BamB
MRIGTVLISALFSMLLASAPAPAPAENWPDFRGPTRDGIASGTTLPLKWSESNNIRWKTKLPGLAWSSPVVWGSQIWVTNAPVEGKKLSAICLDLKSGRVVREVLLFNVEKHARWYSNDINSHASPSPVIGKGRVYCSFGTYGTACVDTTSGKVLWRRNDINIIHFEGPGSSPVLFEDLLILTMDGIDKQFLIALDAETGRTKWRTPRSRDFTGMIKPLRKAYTTPLLLGKGAETILVSVGAQAAYGYIARTGKEQWRVDFRGWSNSSRPFSDGKQVFINTGYMKPQLWAVRLGGNEVTQADRVQWKRTSAVPSMSSPVLMDGLIYMVTERGIASCVDASNGKFVWRERIGGKIYASALAAAGCVYFFDRDGKTTVVKQGREFKILATNKLEAGGMASVAVSGKALILRTESHLYRIEEN